MNALLSMGNLTGNTLTCPFHGSKFDVITGRKLTEPILTPSQEMEPLPPTWQKFLENVGQLMAYIKTHDQTSYETRLDGDRIKIKI
jgi:nitrite reductase/ring-hydroxylating ferredoxin subunit